VTVHRQLPPSHVGSLALSHVWAQQEKASYISLPHHRSPSNASALTPTSAHQLCSPWPTTAEPPLCCPTRSKGAPRCRAPPTPRSSPGHRLPKPSNRGSCATVYLREELTVDHRHLSTFGLATTSRRTARVCSSTTSTPTPPMTFSLSGHRHPPAVIFPHCR
jgi:hypothetical protein